MATPMSSGVPALAPPGSTCRGVLPRQPTLNWRTTTPKMRLAMTSRPPGRRRGAASAPQPDQESPAPRSPLSNAEKQRRHRDRVKARLQSIETAPARVAAQQVALVEFGTLLAQLAEAWLKLADSAPEIFPEDDVSKVSSLANEMQTKFKTRIHSMPDFTPREQTVMQGLRAGKPNKVIAAELGLSEAAIKIYVRRILRNLQATNRTQAALALRDLG
jgi:DNA-binding CsgD family transcriptional regulator